jgi:hypothetical protein
MDAVRAWVTTGKHALPADAARATLPKVTPEIAEARARFRLGVWLRATGRVAEGDRQMAEASRLHPDSWSLWRQAPISTRSARPAAPTSGNACKRSGDKPYYPPPRL